MRRIIIVFSLVAAGCGDDGDDCTGFGCTDAANSSVASGSTTAPGTTTSPTTGEGFCMDGDFQCIESDVLQYCEDDKLHAVSCKAVCGVQGQPLKCALGSEGHDVCYCGDELGLCDKDGVAECFGGGAARICSDGVWSYTDCDEACVAGGYAGAADPGCIMNGSEPSCQCRDSLCLPDSQYCSGSETLQYCIEGAWQQFTCSEACGLDDHESLGCFFSISSATETCACTV